MGYKFDSDLHPDRRYQGSPGRIIEPPNASAGNMKEVFPKIGSIENQHWFILIQKENHLEAICSKLNRNKNNKICFLLEIKVSSV